MKPSLTPQRPTANVLQRVEPIAPAPIAGSLEDAIIAIEVTIGPSGQASGPFKVFSLGPDRVPPGGAQMIASAGDGSSLVDMANRARGQVGATQAGQFDRLMAAYDAIASWRFEAVPDPIATVIGFNFARGDQSGVASEPVRVGGNVAPPKRLRDVRPIYPADAQARGIQGVVILELVIDGAGIPVSAYAIRPVDGLTMSAVQTALQWRFAPDPTYTRRLMTVTVNYTLQGAASGVPGGVSGGLVGGIEGGVPGGVSAGQSGGGVAGGIVAGAPSFGPPPSQWPAYIRVGGNIHQPTKLVDVRPVYPKEAQDAKVQGVVIVQGLVGTDGKVLAGYILRSIPVLDQAALDAVQQWEFTPTLLNGVPTPVAMTVTVNFTLK